ncbi:TPA: YxeA family protein [Clostridium perfringens]|nr:YxeA family protein [Clostridium perfringens]HAT4344495.1 YxeA family protein [Clostridium perfringens]
MMYIKKIIIGIFIVTILSGLVGCTRLNEINTDVFYVKVTQDGKERKEPYIKNGEKKIFIYYQYENVDAYDKNGKEIKVRFTSDKKQLRKDSYLEIRVRDTKEDTTNEIISYKEVNDDDVPNNVKIKLDR